MDRSENVFTCREEFAICLQHTYQSSESVARFADYVQARCWEVVSTIVTRFPKLIPGRQWKTLWSRLESGLTIKKSNLVIVCGYLTAGTMVPVRRDQFLIQFDVARHAGVQRQMLFHPGATRRSQRSACGRIVEQFGERDGQGFG